MTMHVNACVCSVKLLICLFDCMDTGSHSHLQVLLTENNENVLLCETILWNIAGDSRFALRPSVYCIVFSVPTQSDSWFDSNLLQNSKSSCILVRGCWQPADVRHKLGTKQLLPKLQCIRNINTDTYTSANSNTNSSSRSNSNGGTSGSSAISSSSSSNSV